MEKNFLSVEEIKKETLVYNVNQLFEKYGKDYVLSYLKQLVEENETPQKKFDKLTENKKNLQWAYQNL